MLDSGKYVRGKKTVVKSNRGIKYHFIPYYAKEEPEGLWDDVYRALKYIGAFDKLDQ